MQCHCPPSRSLYLSLISSSSSFPHLLQLFSRSIVSGLHPDLLLSTALLNRLASLSHLSSPPLSLSLSLFSSVPNPDLFLANSLIRALPLSSSLPRRHYHLHPNNFTYSFLFSSFPSPSDPSLLPYVRILHARSILDGFSTDPFVASSLINLYLNLSLTSSANHVFDQIPQPDTVSWNSLISGLVQNSDYGKAVRVFGRMLGQRSGVDTTTIAVVLPAVGELRDWMLGAGVHCLGVKSGVVGHSHVVTGLISMYSKCGDVAGAEIVFGGIYWPDVVCRNAMISGYTSNGYVESAVGLFNRLVGSGGRPNSSTMVGLIPVLSPFGHEFLAHSIHGFVLKSGFDKNSSVSTAITTVYIRLNDLESARMVFDEMPDKTMASWNAMISGYAQNGLTEMAISLFREMQSLKVQPNPVTTASILSACAQLGALTLGKWVHQMVDKEEVEPNVYVLTALIDMYAKCGRIEEARRIFDNMHEKKNVVSWNAMIMGYGLHGKGREALVLFEEMLASDQIRLSGVTFLSVLNACSHGGLVEEGHRIYRSMERDHGVRAGPEHYACMVDMLGRAGRLKEALQFIEEVPSVAGPGVWGALLGACMIHRNTTLAQLASKRLFELDPENPGYYVLLSNIYSASRNFPKAAKVREAFKNRRMEKTPGCTLIEINNTVHTFTSSDRTHPKTTEIYAMLDKTMKKAAESGYRVETDSALYDVEEEEKEWMVKVHSEKLAIAFGLISTEPGSEIRIIKNLRVCLDCHNATKYISLVTGRVIVVRDANRFHHFRDGVCSCGDYW